MTYRIIITFVFFSLLLACSTVKNKFLNRNYHNIVAKYNTLFNGQETFNQMTSKNDVTRQLDFTQLLKIEVIDTSSSSSQVNSSTSLSPKISGKIFKNKKKDSLIGYARSEAKAYKAIENHSMEIGERERNKRIDDAYMLLGKARYYQNRPFQALEAFNYIISYHKEHNQVNNAKIWAAKTYKLAGNTYVAVDRLKKLLKNKKRLKKKQIVQIYEQLAIIEIEAEKYDSAINYITNANKYEKNKTLRHRNHFIAAQLYQKLNKPLESSREFAKILDDKPNIDFLVFSTIGIASNFEGEDKHDIKLFLNELTSLEGRKKYYFYRGDIQCKIGEVYFKSKDYENAEKYFNKALKSNTKLKQTTDLAYFYLGEIAFNQEIYELTASYYDSVGTNLPEDKKELFSEKSEALSAFVKYINLKKENDSILELAELPKEKQIILVENLIKKKKKEQEAREKEKESESFKSGKTHLDKNEPFNISFSRKWYFYSNAAYERGKIEFKKQWGERALRQNWRWSKRKFNQKLDVQKVGYVNEKNITITSFKVEDYLKTIPKTEKEKNILKTIRDSSSLEIGKIYAYKFQNQIKAIDQFKSILKNNPIAKFKVKANFELYRIFKKLDENIAKSYKDEALKGKEYLVGISEKNILGLKPTSSEALKEYKRAFKKFEEGNYKDALEIAQKNIKKYNKELIAPKFELLSAYCFGYEKNITKFTNKLQFIANTYLGYKEGDKAQQLIKIAEKELYRKKLDEK